MHVSTVLHFTLFQFFMSLTNKPLSYPWKPSNHGTNLCYKLSSARTIVKLAVTLSVTQTASCKGD